MQENKIDIEIVDQTNSTKSDDNIEAIEVLLEVNQLLASRENKADYSLMKDIKKIQVQIGFEVARANGGTLGVEQQPNRLAHLFCELSNSRHKLTYPSMLGMAHV